MIKIVRIPGGVSTSNLTSGTVAQVLADAGVVLASGEAASVGGNPVTMDTQVSSGASIVISKSAKGNARVQEVVQIDGVNADQFSVDGLFTKAQDLAKQIDALTKSNEKIGSAKIDARIKSLNDDLKKVTQLLDSREDK